MQDDRRVIVIGSGPSGAMAAHALARRQIPVVLLESGLEFQGGRLLRLMGRNLHRRVPPMEHARHHVATGDPRTDWYVNRAPGGLTNQWTGAVPRFAPEDFHEGERLHERFRWPIDYEDLVPYYEQAERLLQITAAAEDVPGLPAGHAAYRHELPLDWLGVASAARAHGQGLTALPLADGPRWLLARRGTAFNSYTNVVRPLEGSARFRLLRGAHVLRLEWAAAKRRVDAVVYEDRRSGVRHRLEAAAVVVACGPLFSTKLLFDSACADFPQGLGNADGVLGAYLHDHPKEWWGLELDEPLTLLAPAAYLTRRPPASSSPLLAHSWTLGTAGLRDKVRSRFGLKGRGVGVQMFGTMVPSERHHVRPSATLRDAFGLPLLEICIRYEEAVLQNMVAGRRHLLDLLEEAGCRARAWSVEPQLVPGAAVHYGGTARMHRSRRHGVVDEWNRVFDVRNVLVCDASCFPTGCEKNPTLTAMALAARAADRLASDLLASQVRM